MRALALIPAYNEARFIEDVLRRLLRVFSPRDILVVDDGSDDGTGELALSFGVNLLRNPRNLGKGASLRRGFLWALERGYEAVLTLDADGQHPPELAPRFLEEARRADLVLGCRYPFRGMPLPNRLSNTITSLTISVMTSARVYDSQIGYRLIKAEVLKAVNLKTTKFQTESELLVKALWMGFKLAFVPVPVIYSGQRSHIKPLDVPRALWLALKLLWERA